eukprot:CAMPEP_0194486252 /NCGR_PEP_ID=MMETSP0253-20130528/6978_1 /TAXON_ID=2966 /ORGANISM="Noctiluca scintillans" /LENGTH=68 /DNA_ID=CAMNT_0039326323 /DNA_START=12 /DNA_END=215 /DNA_ORIENTATION=-
MVKFGGNLHDQLAKGGFAYDAQKDRYFQRTEAKWDVEQRIEKGRRQHAVPARTVEELLEGEEKLADKL